MALRAAIAKKKAEAKKDEALYGQFESLRERAAQTGEFDKLAEKGDFSGISNLARNWDASIRKEVLEVAMKSLDGSDRKKGEALNNAVLDDCKKLNKLAQAGAKDDVPAASAALRGHVEEFYQLEPRRIPHTTSSTTHWTSCHSCFASSHGSVTRPCTTSPSRSTRRSACSASRPSTSPEE